MKKLDEGNELKTKMKKRDSKGDYKLCLSFFYKLRHSENHFKSLKLFIKSYLNF